mmetsp:Transcript_43120/g.104353  ORF Transcript_43120/g.104353 Transcript_43120/m.104353 type:complete len:317 (-) Transcript_43120:99-1049(-)
MNGGSTIMPTPPSLHLSNGDVEQNPKQEDKSTVQDADLDKDSYEEQRRIERIGINQIYLRWGLAFVVVLGLFVVPNLLVGIVHGAWSLELRLGLGNLPALNWHIWSAVTSIVIFGIQVVTGTTMGGIKFSPKTENPIRRLTHKTLGWVGILTLTIMSVLGTVLAFKYWIEYKSIKTGLGTAMFGIVSFAMVVGGIYAVKIRKDYGLHKDIMITLLVYLFVGGGVVRYLGAALTILNPNKCFGPWQAALAGGISLGIIYPVLWMCLFFRSGRIGETWTKMFFLMAVPALLPVIVGQTTFWIEYKGSTWDSCVFSNES